MGSVLIGNGTWFAPAGGSVPVNTVAPTISGTAQVGQVLTGSDGTWTGTVTSTERVWQLSANGTSDWADIPGATGTTYTPVTGDSTQYVQFGVRQTGPGGASSWAYSSASSQIAATGATAAPVNYGVPLVLGAPEVGSELSVQNGNGDWLHNPTSYASTWQRSDTGTSGWADVGSGTSYTVQAGDAGKYLRRRTVATNSQGSAAAVSGAMGPIQTAGAVPLLSSSDVTYLGFYNVSLPGQFENWLGGLAVNRVGGEVRFLRRRASNNDLVEFTINGVSLGGTISSYTRTWATPGLEGTPGQERGGITVDDQGRVWSMVAYDYTGPDPNPGRIQTFTLGASAITGVKKVSLENLTDRRTIGGVIKVPASAQSAYGIGPYVVGLGGYTSRGTANGTCSIGPALYAMPDPAGYADGATVPAAQVKTLASYGFPASPGRSIFYGFSFTPTGTRVLPGSTFFPGGTVATGTFEGKGPINYLGEGDSRPNGTFTGAPNFLPIPGAFNVSPDPLGHAYMTWRIWYRAGVWIETASRRGVVLVGEFGTKRVWYENSSWDSEGITAELHILDPAHLGQVAAGSRNANSIVPTSMRALSEVDGTPFGAGFDCAFDATTNRLYVMGCGTAVGASSTVTKLHVYQINA